MERMVNLSRNGLSGDAKYGDQWHVKQNGQCPRNLQVPGEILKINWELHRYTNYRVVEDPLIGGIVTLVLANSVEELRTLIGKKSFFIATGFDEGVMIVWKI